MRTNATKNETSNVTILPAAPNRRLPAKSSRRTCSCLSSSWRQDTRRGLSAYLTAMGRFPNYSFGNILEIARQKPDATRVAGLYAWNQLGRKVIKGQKGTIAAKTLAERFGADGSAADWRRFGRAPASLIASHSTANLRASTPSPVSLVTPARSCQTLPPCAQILKSFGRKQSKRAALRLSFAARPSRFPVVVSLSRFRSSPRYQGRPAAADMAFCIAACSHGWSESDIAAALSRDYLSRDPSRVRQNGYIQRPIAKVIRWAA